MEIDFPIEFVVPGLPMSHQSRRSDLRERWKLSVRTASLPTLPEGHFASALPLTATLFYFPDGEMAGDVDNIVKLTLDALTRHVFIDDRQIERIWVQKFESRRRIEFRRVTPTLASAMNARPALYIKLGTDLMEFLA